MALFITPPPPLPISRRLQPELVPFIPPAGSQFIGVGAGSVTLGGAQVGLSLGTAFNTGAGTLSFVGAPVGLALGTVSGNNVGVGQVTFFGYPASLGASTGPVVPTPTVTTFAPALSELGLDAWERVRIQAGALTTTHVNSMRRSMNLVLVRWSNRGVNLWRVALRSITLQAGVATYALPADTIDVLDTYIRTGSGAAASDTTITGMGRDEFAQISNKSQPGAPVRFWFDRTITPSVTLWPVPESDGVYTMPYYAFTQIGDADPTMGNTADLPYRFLEAFTAAVAAHLAIKWGPPELAVALDAYSKECWLEASDEDREKVTLSMAPDFSSYFS